MTSGASGGGAETSAPAGVARAVQPRAPAAAEKAWSKGVALLGRKRFADAAAAFERAAKMAPHVSLFWSNLANARRHLSQHDGAIRAARRAFELDSRSAVACHELVELLRQNNRNTEALAALGALPVDVPRNASHHFLEGALKMAHLDWQGAAAAFFQVLAIQPTHVDAYMHLGFCLANLLQYAEAAECFRTATVLRPNQLGAAIYSAHYAAWACDWKALAEDETRLQKAFAVQEGASEVPPLSPFCLLAMNDDAAMHRQVATWQARRVAADARAGDAALLLPRERGPQGYPRVLAKPRIRVGFVSADFRAHATSTLLVGAIERLNRERFEVALYSHGVDDGSELRQRMVSAADEFVECREMSTREQAQRVRDDGTAILIDMSGYTQQSRFATFVLRPAPIQALWLAYPSTSGGDFIDYIIGDPILTPLEHQDDFVEKIAQLPVCYEPTDCRREHPATLSRAQCGLPEDAFVFACFNQTYKITEAMFARWCRILQRVPNSVLWLLTLQDGIKDKLGAAAARHGVDSARLVFAPFVKMSDHLARLPQADLFLDTFPYGAHTTCSDALWMGLPVLTQIGRSFSARVAASLLSAVGLPDLAVQTEQQYEELAVGLAQEYATLQAVRRHLNDKRLALQLFDSDRFTCELENLLVRMVEHWKQGLDPEPLAAPIDGA
jgi:predicted O-linked N-acetylglucosamine transferase (SPINDLY family)